MELETLNWELGTGNWKLYDMLPLKQLIANHKVQSSMFKVQCLKQLMGFAYHLVLMNELLAGWRLQEIEAAILAAAALAAYGWDDELHGVDAQRIARKLLYPAYEMRL